MAKASASKGDVLFHPVRMRVVLALVGRQLTPRQLAALLPEVPQATLYHHIKLLTEAGMLIVVSERPVRGAVEKVYALPADGRYLAREEVQTASREDLSRYFATFVAALLGDFGRYLEREHVDLVADGVGFRQIAFYASDDEFAALLRQLSDVLIPMLAVQPGPGRTRRAFSTVVMPTPDAPDISDAQEAPDAPDATAGER